jgi:hypothetical protein
MSHLARTDIFLADDTLILLRDEAMPLPNVKDQVISSAIHRAQFRPQVPVLIRIMNARWNANGTVTVITHRNRTAEMCPHYPHCIIMVARTVTSGVIDVKQCERWDKLKIHVVLLVQYIGKCTDALQIMRNELQMEHEGTNISA